MAAKRCHLCGCLVYDMGTHLPSCERLRRRMILKQVTQSCDLLDSVAHRLRSAKMSIHRDIWDVLMTLELAKAELTAHLGEMEEYKEKGSMRCERCGANVHRDKMANHPCEFIRRTGTTKRAYRLLRAARRALIRAEKEEMPEWLTLFLRSLLLNLEEMGQELTRYRNEMRKK